MTLEERIAKLETRLSQLEQESKECKANMQRLTTVCQQVIATMSPVLTDLSLRGQSMTSYYESEFPLSDEEMKELRTQYHRASRKVERAYAQALMQVAGFQQG